MEDKRYYTGIDIFRIIAAFLVVAIHVSPLSDISATADFLFTRIICRVAVPFFFMTTGFFLFSGGEIKAEKVKRSLKKTSIIYLISILLYLPINIYAGFFKADDLPLHIFHSLVFDGTMNHLWYLPAAILGIALTSLLIKKLGIKKALIIASVLYIIGLFGDSYYGLIKDIPIISDIYEAIFKVTVNTRNGPFFAPLFLTLGALASASKEKTKNAYLALGTAASLVLMCMEGLLLNKYKLQNGDRMYIMLIPLMIFLFSLISSFKGSKLKGIKNVSLIIYIIHPLLITCLSIFSGIIGLKGFLFGNNLVQYLLVSMGSLILALILEFAFSEFVKRNKKNG